MSFTGDPAFPIELRPSPNHGPRAENTSIDTVILHYTGMQSADDALDRLCDPAAEVSAHYVVLEDGAVIQCVSEDRRAWHAGRSYWRGDTDINSRSIGVEIVNPGHEFGYRPFPEAQINAVVALLLDICGRRPVAPWLVLAHSDVSPDRKEDPGELFPWRRLFEAGIGHFVEPFPAGGGQFFQEGDSGQPVEALQSMLAMYGYKVDVSGTFDTATRDAVSAFQRHFRPERVDGIADISTISTLHALLSALPLAAQREA